MYNMSTMDSQKEKIIIGKILQKDEKALFEVYNMYRRPLYNFVNKQLNDSHKAEELIQDIFFDFIESLRDFQYECSLKTYLFSIARNKVIDTIRKKKIKRILFSSMPAYILESLTAVMFDDGLEKKELSTKIKDVFDHLPNDYKMVLRLKYIEGVKVKTIANKLSLGFKATESLIYRARKAFIKVFQTST